MANRVLRDWTTSDAMDKLSAGAEVFFTRLIMKADDFGSYYANNRLLKSGLFPLKDGISEGTIKAWVDECVSVGLLFKYTVKGKEFLRIHNFNQRLRNMRNAFPHPDDNSQQVAATRSELPPETKRNETEVETETESETETNDVVCDLKDLDAEVVKLSADLTEGICKYFSVKTIVLSPRYNKVCDFVSTVANKNRIREAVNIFEAYKTYKSRSKEAVHGVETWIGTKQNHYEDGHWTMTDWIDKEKNYRNHAQTKGTSGPTSTKQVGGTDYSGDRRDQTSRVDF